MNPSSVVRSFGLRQFNCRRLWRDGAVHDGASSVGWTSWISEFFLPTDQPFRYDGTVGSYGREAGFLFHSSIHSSPIPGIADLLRLVSGLRLIILRATCWHLCRCPCGVLAHVGRFRAETMTFGRVAGRKQQKRCCTQLRMKDVDEETLQIYEIQREIQSLKHELREQQWTLEEKSQHEDLCHAEYDDRCEVCVRVRTQFCDNSVEQANINLCHRVTELQDENRKLKQQVGELKRVNEKVRVEMKTMTLEFYQELDWQLKQNDADRIRLESENKSLLQEIQQCKQALDMNRKSFALKERDLRDQCAHLEK